MKVTESPNVDGFSPEPTTVDVFPGLTVCESAGVDVLAALSVSPPYAAVMLCGPTASDDVVRVAVPEASVPVPSVVLPSRNVTVPVAVAGETVAVNVTGSPFWDGLSFESSPVVVAIWFTTWETGDDVLLVSFVSPPYAAVIE